VGAPLVQNVHARAYAEVLPTDLWTWLPMYSAFSHWPSVVTFLILNKSPGSLIVSFSHIFSVLHLA
jgi:hypothetical protein